MICTIFIRLDDIRNFILLAYIWRSRICFEFPPIMSWSYLNIHIKNQSVLKYFSRKFKILRASPIFWVCDTRKNIFSSWSTILCHGIYITQVCNVRAAIWMINFCYQIGTRKVGYWYVFVCDSPFESCGLSVSVF